MIKFLPILAEILVVIFSVTSFSLVSIGVFKIKPKVSRRPNRSEIASFALIAVLTFGIWLAYSQVLSFQVNLYLTDIRRIIDRASPVSTLALDRIGTSKSDRNLVAIDLSHSCNGVFADDTVLLEAKSGSSRAKGGNYVELIDFQEMNIDLDLMIESIIFFECGASRGFKFVHILDDDGAYQVSVGPAANNFSLNGSEIALTEPRGQYTCCPTHLVTRFYHFRRGSLLEHRPADEVEI